MLIYQPFEQPTLSKVIPYSLAEFINFEYAQRVTSVKSVRHHVRDVH